jgi:hypothetical protein
MAEAALFVGTTPRQEKAFRPIAAVFTVAGLAWGAISAPALTIEPQISDAWTTLKAAFLDSMMHGFAIMIALFLAAILLRRSVPALGAAVVAVAAFGTPLAAPFALEAAGAVAYREERQVLAALEADARARTAQEEARMAEADLAGLLTVEVFGDRKFDAYRARVESYRQGALALKALADGREAALGQRLAAAGAPAARRERMLQTLREAAAAEAERAAAIHALRLETAKAADEALNILQRPRTWGVWVGRLSFADPQAGADFGRLRGEVRSNLANLRRLEGKRGVIGATAQKRAS